VKTPNDTETTEISGNYKNGIHFLSEIFPFGFLVTSVIFGV